MALERTHGDDQELGIKISNGQLKALRDAVTKWSFKDEESALTFAIAVLAASKQPTLDIVDEDGTKKSVAPADNLKK